MTPYRSSSSVAVSNANSDIPSPTDPPPTPPQDVWVPESSFSEDLAVSATSITLTSKTAKEQTVLPIQTSYGQLGLLTIPPDTFLPGCTIRIPKLSKTQRQRRLDERASLCPSETNCQDKVIAELATPTVQLQLHGECNHDGSKFFKNELELELLGLNLNRVDHKVLCFAFREDDSKDWSCLKYFNQAERKRLSLYRTKTNHFTTFAVLFSNDVFHTTSEESNALWITSIVLTGVAIGLVAVVMVVYVKVTSFQRWIKGFEKTKSIGYIVQKQHLRNELSRLEKGSALI